MKKLILSSALLCYLFTSTGCFGTFQAVRYLHEWNEDVSDNKWVQTAVFWGLNIIPVYSIFSFGDLVIFNVIEFWSGDNPLSMNEDESQEQWVTHEDRTFKIRATKNKFVVLEYNDNNQMLDKAVLKYHKTDHTWRAKKNDLNIDVLQLLDHRTAVLAPGTEYAQKVTASDFESDAK